MISLKNGFTYFEPSKFILNSFYENQEINLKNIYPRKIFQISPSIVRARRKKNHKKLLKFRKIFILTAKKCETKNHIEIIFRNIRY